MASYLANADLKDLDILTVTFGPPKVGDKTYALWADNSSNLAIWRFVLKDDPVPRLPIDELNYYYQAGNLVQIEDSGMTAYYRQYGDASLGLAGVPDSWTGE